MFASSWSALHEHSWRRLQWFLTVELDCCFLSCAAACSRPSLWHVEKRDGDTSFLASLVVRACINSYDKWLYCSLMCFFCWTKRCLHALCEGPASFHTDKSWFDNSTRKTKEILQTSQHTQLMLQLSTTWKGHRLAWVTLEEYRLPPHICSQNSNP